MKNQQQFYDSIERFRAAFWERKVIDRPPVGVYSECLLLPVQYAKQDFTKNELLPGDIEISALYTDYEFDHLTRRIFSDDWIPFCAPWRAVPWLEAICGCPVHHASGSLAAQPCWDEERLQATLPIQPNRQWLQLLMHQLSDLSLALPQDCWISPTLLRGPSDVLAALRGMEAFMFDLYDRPLAIKSAAWKINTFLSGIWSAHFSTVKPKLGGYGHIYGYWAPERTVVLQEDIMGLVHPDKYREIFQKFNEELVRSLGACVFFHLHSTGMQHYQDVMHIPGLAGIELTVEANGPHLTALIPVLREILHHSRLILFVDGYFDELYGVLEEIPHKGLYLLISDDYIKSEEEFHRFIGQIWPARSSPSHYNRRT